MKERKEDGFTLVELAIVIVIVGVLAAFAVPRFRDSVERSKASEAFSYLSAMRSAQERYHARMATYASDPTKLDVEISSPKFFTVGTLEARNGSLEKGWKLTLARVGASAGYGAYTVVFNEQGYDASGSSIGDAAHAAINPMAD